MTKREYHGMVNFWIWVSGSAALLVCSIFWLISDPWSAGCLVTTAFTVFTIAYPIIGVYRELKRDKNHD